MLLMTIVMLLTTSDASALRNNVSSKRIGRAKLREDLRAHCAFRNKVSPAGDNNIVNIHFEYQHFEVLMIDEVEQAVTSIGYVNMSWKDPDLTWNKTDYGGVDFITLSYYE